MLPAANLLGFAGQELARKMPQKSIAVVMETTFGSVVEIILFMVLLKRSIGNENVQVIQAAILGSILANILLCLGCCFIAGKIRIFTSLCMTGTNDSQVVSRTRPRSSTRLSQSLATVCCWLRQWVSCFLQSSTDP
jgi:calcium/proton exchanger cax